jgi:hypothetical protein
MRWMPRRTSHKRSMNVSTRQTILRFNIDGVDMAVLWWKLIPVLVRIITRYPSDETYLLKCRGDGHERVMPL